MIERITAGAAVILCLACGPSKAELALREQAAETQIELKELHQYIDDLKFRMQLAEARNRVLIDLVQGLTIDPEHYEAQANAFSSADASLQSLDRDIEALVASVRHSRSDVEALRAQRQALQEELAQARRTIETARATQQEDSARASTLREILLPLTDLIQSARINVSVAFGQFSIQVPESALFGRSDPNLHADGKALLGRIATGLLTAPGRTFRILSPRPATSANERAARQRELSIARALAVLDQLVSAGIAAESSVAHTQPGAADRYVEIQLVPKAEELPSLPNADQLLGEAQ